MHIRLCQLLGLIAALSFWACAPDRPASSAIAKKMKYTVVIGITPDEHGRVARCVFAQSSDLATAARVDFTPSDAYVAEACARFRGQHWSVRRDEAGVIKEVYTPCLYSEAIPEHPVFFE